MSEQFREIEEGLKLISEKMQDYPNLDGTIEELEQVKQEILEFSQEVLGNNYKVVENALLEHLNKRILLAVNNEEL